jgi:hypothetical protein
MIQPMDPGVTATVKRHYRGVFYRNMSMMVYRRVNVLIYILLTSVLVGGEWSASPPGHFTP